MKKHSCRFWIDFSDFSGKGRDLGVRAAIEKWGFLPAAVTVFSTCPDFVHEHDGKIDNTVLRREYASYNGWNRSQRWTRAQCKKVVQELQKHGIKVYLTCMSNAYQPSFEKFSQWAKQHPELFVVHDTGKHDFTTDGLFSDMYFYHIAARFKDGSYYEDFFTDQVVRTVNDYGFDGFFAADGYKSFIMGLMAACFSRDMLEQFEEDTGIRLPEYRKGKLTDAIPPVAQWIWQKKRLEWIDFWRRRFARSWKKVGGALKKAGKEFAIISAWNTDPLESISRYGMDTQALEQAPAGSLCFETHDIHSITGPIAGPASERREGYLLEGPQFYYSSLVSCLLRAAHTPRIKHYPMLHVHDVFERFDALKSSPAYLERAIVGYQQSYHVRKGRAQPATRGLWYTIPVLVTADQWRFLASADRLGRSVRPAGIPGPVALWSASTIENELPTSRKKWSVHRTLYELASAGLPLVTSSRVEEIKDLKKQVLLWANPGSFSDEEQQAIWQSALRKRHRLIVFDSRGEFSVPRDIPALEIVDAHSGARLVITGTPKQVETARKHLSDEAGLMKKLKLVRQVKARGRKIEITPTKRARPYEYRPEMERHFLTRVPPYRLSSAYLELCAAVCQRISWPLLDEVRIQHGPGAGEQAGQENSVYYIEDKKGGLYLFAINLHRHASYLQIRWTRKIKSARQLNSIMYLTKPVGKEMELMVPAWGVTVCQVELA